MEELNLHLQSKEYTRVVTNTHRCVNRTVFQKGIVIFLSLRLQLQCNLFKGRVQNHFECSIASSTVMNIQEIFNQNYIFLIF